MVVDEPRAELGLERIDEQLRVAVEEAVGRVPAVLVHRAEHQKAERRLVLIWFSSVSCWCRDERVEEQCRLALRCRERPAGGEGKPVRNRSRGTQSIAKIWLPCGHTRLPSTARSYVDGVEPQTLALDVEARRVRAEPRDDARRADERHAAREAQPARPARQPATGSKPVAPRSRARRSRCCRPTRGRRAGAPNAAA